LDQKVTREGKVVSGKEISGGKRVRIVSDEKIKTLTKRIPRLEGGGRKKM